MGAQSDTYGLEVAQLTVRFGGIVAVDHVSFVAAPGELCAVIGPNGAGKTTLFNAVSGLNDAMGTVRLGPHDVLATPAHRRPALGIARTFQNLALWPGLSVVENVMVGAHHRGRRGFWSAPFGVGVGRENARLEGLAREHLELLGISDLADHPCGGLPYGTLKRVEIARALAANPTLLMLDEPASGLTHGEVAELGDLILDLRRQHRLTVLLVEHHMELVMTISDHVVALDFGRVIASGTPNSVQHDPAVVEAYLGAPV